MPPIRPHQGKLKAARRIAGQQQSNKKHTNKNHLKGARPRAPVDDDHEEEDEYMKRIRARMEKEDGTDTEEEEEQDDEEEEEEEEGSEPEGRYHQQDDFDNDDDDDQEEEEEEEEEEEDGSEEEGGYGSDDYDAASASSEEEGDDRDDAEAMRNMPLAERLALMACGADKSRKSTTSKHDSKATTSRTSSSDKGKTPRPTGATTTGTSNDTKAMSKWAKKKLKEKPQEMSSKVPVGRFRKVVEPKKNRSRDPRFEDVSGTFNYDMFRKAYSFLDDYEEKEINLLQEAAKKERNEERKNEVKAALKQMQQTRGDRLRGERKMEVLRSKKKAEKDLVAQGKKPFYLKRREKKRIELEDRYEHLAKEGKLEKAMEKKRKRNAAKDHRWLPRKRREMGE